MGRRRSLAAMIGYRNKRMSGHIISVEDPIEYVHFHGKSLVTQREVAGISKENPRPEVPFIPVKLVYSGEVTDAFQDIVREELAELASGLASGDAVGGGAVGTGEHGDGEAVGVGGGEVGGVA